MKTFALILLVAALSACGPSSVDAPAPSPEQPVAALGVEIRDAWAAPTPNGIDVSAGYLTIANSGEAEDQLIAVSTVRAERAEIHEMTMEGGVMRMRAITSLTIPAGGEASLAPGGQHLMFFGVTQGFVEGEDIPVTLTFAHAGERQITLPVRAPGATQH